MKRIIRPLILILLLVALVAGGYWYYRNRSASTAAAAASTNFTQVVDVTRGNLSAAISVVGELDAVENAELAFERMSGTAKLESLLVKAGNTVKAGQVLATIDATPYQQALDQAKSDLQAAEETLAELKTPTTALDIAKADLTIATAEYQGQQAQDTLANLLQPDLAQLKVGRGRRSEHLGAGAGQPGRRQVRHRGPGPVGEAARHRSGVNGRAWTVGHGELF